MGLLLVYPKMSFFSPCPEDVKDISASFWTTDVAYALEDLQEISLVDLW